MSLIQNNDQRIRVGISDGTEAFDISNVTSAEYRLFSRSGKVELVSKSLNDGITYDATHFSIIILAADCEDLHGQYFHEFTIVDPSKGRTTVFSQELTITPTKM